MKINWDKKYTTIAIYAFIVICFSIVFANIISKLDAFTGKMSQIMAVFQPFIIGFIIAYLINFILKFYEDRVFKKFIKGSKKSLRGVAVILSYLTASLIFYVFIQFVVPQLVESITGLVNDIPRYLYDMKVILEQTLNETDISPEYMTLINDKLTEITNWVLQLVTNLLPIIGGIVMAFASSVWNIILGIIISVYLLVDKEKFFALGKKVVVALFNDKHANIILNLANRTNLTFGKFIGGKIIDSAIIGVLTFIILTIFKMPYSLLISVIIGITNIIPFFGPFIGAIPSAIIILFISPIKAVWFGVIILVIQQIDGNIIGPKILGDSIGISAFWILFAILVAGKLFGLVGMIIGVPMFALIYSIVKDVIEIRLSKKGLPTDTTEYL
ncbi:MULTISPECIES: AI-2E family transporter [Turicibacter]|jgi:putative membrane protein|uniref:AI-2E family transporter n=2 Tax=Turicibacteraceae TaxID=2810281 RepID=A0A6G2CNK9_9FIRM|nr:MULTISPECIES: AI-2E family transporter [Turicibacter]EGC90889.1 putative membrane protein [Turicibacter sp. HGF1]MCU7195630.1 AI-2E family transporter [Turicibacter sanguinis]MCU7203320.1 AI-2E family transporter [Turicibacter sanguinis]MDB8540979.1 AI-2E family transporter [Turicibacter sanguinis]MDB8554670.1 AI-2E family transporter [Turicibacter sanguinis]